MTLPGWDCGTPGPRSFRIWEWGSAAGQRDSFRCRRVPVLQRQRCKQADGRCSPGLCALSDQLSLLGCGPPVDVFLSEPDRCLQLHPTRQVEAGDFHGVVWSCVRGGLAALSRPPSWSGASPHLHDEDEEHGCAFLVQL